MVTCRFDGAIAVGSCPRPPNRQFQFHGFLRPSLGIYAKLAENGQKPPTHFHPYQWEFFRVLKGNLTIDLNGVPKHLSKGDGELAVRPYVHHTVYGTPGTETYEVEFMVSASDVRDPDGVVLDQAFFENWYGYQEDVFQRGESLDLIQVLAVGMLIPTTVDRSINCGLDRCSMQETPICRLPGGSLFVQ